VAADEELFRSRQQVTIAVVFGIAVAAVGVGTAGEARSTAGAVFQAVGCVALAALLIVAIGRSGLWASRTGVRIRNPFSTSVVAWAEIRTFRIGRRGLLGAVCRVDLVDGSSKSAFAIQVPNLSLGRPDTKEGAMVARLNELLEAHRATIDA
jgi:hypothetical protein